MSFIRVSYKTVCFLTALVTYLMVTFPLYLFFKISPYKALPLIQKVVKFYTSFALFFIHIRLEVDIARLKELMQQNYLIVSNHLSYLDILAYCSLFPASFVTSVEIKRTPVLGQITQGAGCMFVERRNKKNLSREVKEITDALKNGFNVMIFPEATSTDGKEVLMFKRALFKGATDSGIPVLPMTINYTFVDDEPVSTQNRDEVFWYGDMDFVSHLYRVFKRKEVCIHIKVHEPIESKERDITELANECQKIVSSEYKPIV